ncbi:MAG: hypothetical protein Ct9H300mP3_07560 [Gammaproteobacteria bacterium]|nr:MAG: hypothetical protein Ct9H300mP3_07560 [Gammaproteobacteria bacterium]
MRGYVTAYDTETGEQVWRFFTVPGNPSLGFEDPAMEMAARPGKVLIGGNLVAEVLFGTQLFMTQILIMSI